LLGIIFDDKHAGNISNHRNLKRFTNIFIPSDIIFLNFDLSPFIIIFRFFEKFFRPYRENQQSVVWLNSAAGLPHSQVRYA
jgi:hypothetical protein